MSTVQSKRSDGLFEIISFPGSRIFEMRKSDVNGNLLTKASLLAMSKKLEVYEENHTIGTYMIGNNFLSEYLFLIDVEYKQHPKIHHSSLWDLIIQKTVKC